MNYHWMLLSALIGCLVSRIKMECISVCTGVSVIRVCAFNGCFFNADQCALGYFNCHREKRGKRLMYVAAMGDCGNQHQPRCTTVDF